MCKIAIRKQKEESSLQIGWATMALPDLYSTQRK